MKKLITLLSFFLIGCISVFSQSSLAIAPDYVGWVYKSGPPETLFEYVGDEVDLELTLKNTLGEPIYTEHFSTTIKTGGYVAANFGLGNVDINSLYQNYFEAYHEAVTICPKVTIHDQTGDITIMGGEQKINSTPQALYAREATNASSYGGRSWSTEPLDPEYLFNPPDDVTLCAMIEYKNELQQKREVRSLLSRKLMSSDQKPSAVNAQILRYILFKAFLGYPVVFGNEKLAELENWMTICAPSLKDFYNAFAVKVPQEHSPALNHPTAAIYAENIFDELGVGLFANGASRGVYAQGQTGVLGLTTGTGSGAGVWARVQTEPALGGTKYGLYAESQSLPNSYAAYLNGNSIYTGTLTQTSDARLKTNITTSAYGLSTILKLQPKQYEYLDNTPYHFSKGLHQGFLAQEVEEVLPELVSDVAMPNSFDPLLISESGTTSYKTVNYIEMIPVLTQAIQELNAKVDAQAAEIAQLKKEQKSRSKTN